MRTRTDKCSVHMTERYADKQLSCQLFDLLTSQEGFGSRPVIILCIGSDRYTGDALGPLIGSELGASNISTMIFGSLDDPVHAGNLVETIGKIERLYDQPVIVAIDACLGKKAEIGNIEIWEGALQAGIAVGNKLPAVGHISMIGVVNASSQLGYFDLQSTPLSTVIKLSKIISSALITVFRDLIPGKAGPTSYIKQQEQR